MSLLRRVARGNEARGASDPGQPGLTLDQWMRIALEGRSTVSESSVQDPETAQRHSVVYRCVHKNAGTIAGFPVRQLSNGRPVSLAAIVARPSPGLMRRRTWTKAAVASMYLRGAAAGFVGPVASAAMGRPSTVHLFDAAAVDWTIENGWTVNGKPEDLWPNGRLFYVPLNVLPGSPLGLNPLKYARLSLYAGLAAQEFGGNFFRDGAHPTAIVTTDDDPGPTAADRLKRQIRDAVSGTSREPLVLPNTVKWQQIQISPEDSQFLDLIRATDEQICRFMGTPPLEVGVIPSGGSTVTYANREQNKADYVQELLPAMTMLEDAIGELLPQPQEVRFITAGFLRADTKTRYETYKLAAEIKQATGKTFLDTSEMRDFEDLGPLPAGVDDTPATTDTGGDDDAQP